MLNNKERLQKQARNKYRDLFVEKKNILKEYMEEIYAKICQNDIKKD